MAEIDMLVEFKTQIVTFFDELIEQVPEEGDLVVARILLKDQLPIIDVMNHFIQEILPLKDLVVSRNEEFFLKNNILFDEFDKNRVNHFKKIWRSERLDQSDKDAIWDWFRIFIKIAEKYQKLKH